MKKEASLSIVIDEKQNRVLLIKHHRGINEGFFNFPGGKKDPGETMVECARRETYEETGVTPIDPVQVGQLEFETFSVTVFKSVAFVGTLKENGAEVDVFWQDLNNLPYDKMRESDRDFVPMILRGEYVHKFYHYGPDRKLIRVDDLSQK